MKKIFALILAVLVMSLFPPPSSALGQDGTTEAGEENSEPPVIIEPNPLLKDVNYVRLQCKFNGMTYYKGFRKPQDAEMIEFNLDEAETALKDAAIPITKDDIRALYQRAESQLKKAGVRLLDIRPRNSKRSSVVPAVDLNVDIQPAAEESYVVLVYLTVSKWMSAWSVSGNVQAPVIVWWQKKALLVPTAELSAKISETAMQLAEVFQAHLAAANPPPGEATTYQTTVTTKPTN